MRPWKSRSARRHTRTWPTCRSKRSFAPCKLIREIASWWKQVKQISRNEALKICCNSQTELAVMKLMMVRARWSWVTVLLKWLVKVPRYSRILCYSFRTISWSIKICQSISLLKIKLSEVCRRSSKNCSNLQLASTRQCRETPLFKFKREILWWI